MKIKRGRDEKAERLKSRSDEPISFDKQKPVFSLHSQHPEWNVECCSDAHKVAFLDAIHKRSQLSWIQLRGYDHRKLGFEPIPRYLLRDLQMPPTVTDDTQLLVFRCNINKMRVVGYRQDATFHVIWIDGNGVMWDHD